jgi:hypothetical protein
MAVCLASVPVIVPALFQAELASSKRTLSAPPPRKTRFGSPLVFSRVHWAEPPLVAEIAYLTWTADGLCRGGIQEESNCGQIHSNQIRYTGFSHGACTPKPLECSIPLRPMPGGRLMTTARRVWTKTTGTRQARLAEDSNLRP